MTKRIYTPASITETLKANNLPVLKAEEAADLVNLVLPNAVYITANVHILISEDDELTLVEATETGDVTYTDGTLYKLMILLCNMGLQQEPQPAEPQPIMSVDEAAFVVSCASVGDKYYSDKFQKERTVTRVSKYNIWLDGVRHSRNLIEVEIRFNRLRVVALEPDPTEPPTKPARKYRASDVAQVLREHNFPVADCQYKAGGVGFVKVTSEVRVEITEDDRLQLIDGHGDAWVNYDQLLAYLKYRKLEVKPALPRKGLLCNIYRSDFDSPIAALRGKQRVVLVGEGVPEIFEPSEDAPAVALVKFDGCGREVYLHAEPVDGSRSGGTRSYAFDGTFIYTSDSRFPSRYPLALHDRQMWLEGR